MPRFVALLRGVNVGKGRRLAMADFRRLLEAAGFTEVRTLLNSGNAVFASTGRSSTEHARTIAAALQHGLGLQVMVVVRSAREFGAVIAGTPLTLPAQEHARLIVAFAQERHALRQLAPLADAVQAPERFVVGEHAAYLHCARGILQSRAASALLGKAGRDVTTRNWATVLKLGKLLRGDPPRRLTTDPVAKET
jgi:uncharacterized protein (DUF1697 family)